MGEIKGPSPVKLVVGMISAFRELFAEAEKELSRKLGTVDYHSPVFSFVHTDYYQSEMGGNLQRIFISFQELISPEYLSEIKIFTNQLEKKFLYSDGKSRRINLDPGYISAAKLILASTKDHRQRIYLGKGIYAEITLYYQGKKFLPWEWTYPDYRTEEYRAVFETIRRKYVLQLKELGQGGNSHGFEE